MRASCNGCRVLRKGCGDDCSIRNCLSWIKSPESQAHATVFLAKFYGRAGLINLINGGPHHLRHEIFRSLLYEACGRIVNPIYGSVGLLWSGSWHLCQAAVESVLRGAPITPIASKAAVNICGPPLMVHDIRHISKDSKESGTGTRKRCRFKRTGAPRSREVKWKDRSVKKGGCDGELNLSQSHESSLSYQSEGVLSGCRANPVGGNIKEATDIVHSGSVPELDGRGGGVAVALELTLGLEPSSRADHVVPFKKRMCTGNGTDGLDFMMGMRLGL